MNCECDRVSVQADGEALKPYAKPTLRKGPALSDVTAFPAAASGKPLE